MNLRHKNSAQQLVKHTKQFRAPFLKPASKLASRLIHTQINCQTLDTVAQPKQIKWFSFSLHFRPFSCCLSAVAWQRGLPKNMLFLFCPNKKLSFEPWILFHNANSHSCFKYFLFHPRLQLTCQAHGCTVLHQPTNSPRLLHLPVKLTSACPFCTGPGPSPLPPSLSCFCFLFSGSSSSPSGFLCTTNVSWYNPQKTQRWREFKRSQRNDVKKRYRSSTNHYEHAFNSPFCWNINIHYHENQKHKPTFFLIKWLMLVAFLSSWKLSKERQAK